MIYISQIRDFLSAHPFILTNSFPHRFSGFHNYSPWYPSPQPSQQQQPAPQHGLYGPPSPPQMYHYQSPNQKPVPWYCMQYPNAQGCAPAANTKNCPRPLHGRIEYCSANNDDSKSILLGVEAATKTTTFALYCPDDKKVKVILEFVDSRPTEANGDCEQGFRKNVKGTGDVEADWSDWECDEKGPFTPLSNGVAVDGETNEMQLQYKATTLGQDMVVSFNCQCA
ncbi:uncharacterized protein LOC141914232 [Tubulanus polymorphus]|uniref:uncharacterized protein LOC141914232 n=1 Tax=Tubulanus polymorphus TaxID=672921 RepID=UPI003DA38840